MSRNQPPLGSMLAPAIIAAEMTGAFGLLWPPWRRRAARQATVLISVLPLALVANQLLVGRGVCGCWFSLRMAQGDLHFVLNGFLIALSLFVWYAFRRPPEGLANTRSQPPVKAADKE